MDEMDDISLDFFKEIAENGTQGESTSFLKKK